jgi:hypothetical protein
MLLMVAADLSARKKAPPREALLNLDMKTQQRGEESSRLEKKDILESGTSDGKSSVFEQMEYASL